MLTDAPSHARSLASLAGKVRGYLSSMAALRAFIILSFFLYEWPYIRFLFSEQQWLRLPLWDVSIVDHPSTFVLLEGIYLTASVLACFRRFVIPGCFLAAIASILLVSLDLTFRLQFAFLPGGALLAFTLSEILSRSRDPKTRVDLPFVLFLGSVYGFASFHKLLNFHWMRTLLPSSVFGAPGGPTAALWGSADNWLLDSVVWVVVPYEASLAILTLTRRWVKLRLACVSLFHWLLVVLVPHIWHVSLFMLSLHLYLASLQKPSARGRMFAGRNWYGLAGAEALFLVAQHAAPSIPGPAGRVLEAVAFANFALFPLVFFFWTFWRADPEPVVAPAFGSRGFAGAGVAAFGLLVLTFGFSPFLLEKRYSVLSLGWSMFAGGEYRDGTYYTLRTPATPCFRYPVIYNMIWCETRDRQFQYLAFRRADLERLKRLFERRKCGGPPLQVEMGQF